MGYKKIKKIVIPRRVRWAAGVCGRKVGEQESAKSPNGNLEQRFTVNDKADSSVGIPMGLFSRYLSHRADRNDVQVR